MSLHKRVGIIGVGVFTKWLISWSFDFLLYPLIIKLFGFFAGTGTMIILSFFACYAQILFYDKTKKDWVGIETLKEVKDFKPLMLPESAIGKFFISLINQIGNFSAWIMKTSDALFFVFLSIKFDPFITVIHIRHGAHKYNGLSKRDWKVFIASLLIANFYWAIAVYMGITVVEGILLYIKQI